MEGPWFAVTGIPPGEAAQAQRRGSVRAEKLAREGKIAQTMRYRVRGQEVVVTTPRSMAETLADEMRSRGLVVTVKRWKGRRR